MQLSITVIQCYRIELWDLQQGIIGHHLGSHGMAPLFTWISSPCHSFIGSQEPHLFLDSTETELMTSMMEPIPFGIWAQANTCSWNSNGTIRCPLPTTGSMSWQRLGQWEQDITTRWPLYQRNWHQTQRPHYQQQPDRHISNRCHMSTAEGRTPTNEIKDFWLNIWRQTHILQGAMLRP